MEMYGKITGMHYEVKFARMASAFMAEARIIKGLKNFENLPESEKMFLANLHIGADNYKALLNMIEKYGDPEKGLSNLQFWHDPKAQNTMALAIKKEIDTLVPKAGKGDIPFFQQRYEFGRNLMQFTSFFSGVTSTANNRQ